MRYSDVADSSRTEAKQPSGTVMVASRAPSWTISRTAIVRSSSSLNSWPTSSSASSTLGETTAGSARTARRRGGRAGGRRGAPGRAGRVAVGVDDRGHVELVQLADQLAVRARLDAGRQRPGEDDDVGAARQIQQLVAEELELLARHRGPALVDLGLLSGGRVQDGQIRPRLLAD